ncbi:sulfurtransferase TusA family protein [Asaccharospora irregularis]|uniref:sulfurtransferase TusA family protein n=1 Tax=Asaccharospora irregularis TaxID=29359 RepID=UPI0009327E64
MLKLVKLDARGLSCPQPVLMTKKGLKLNPEGIEVLVDNNTACMNVKKFMTHAGYKVSISESEDEFTLTASK